jgi:hypothetical protein
VKTISPQHRVEMLLRQRRLIAETNWNAVASYGTSDVIYIMHDLELAARLQRGSNGGSTKSIRKCTNTA